MLFLLLISTLEVVIYQHFLSKEAKDTGVLKISPSRWLMSNRLRFYSSSVAILSTVTVVFVYIKLILKLFS